MSRFITADRIRAVIADALTEADIVDALRRHRIDYTYSTDTGYLHIRIPCRGGCLRVYRTTQPVRTRREIWGGIRTPTLHPDR